MVVSWYFTITRTTGRRISIAIPMVTMRISRRKAKGKSPEGAAAKLGIPRSTLDTKIKQLGIKKHRFIS
jgi:transcriptional regulator of acetoin/glycerol metabolism